VGYLAFAEEELALVVFVGEVSEQLLRPISSDCTRSITFICSRLPAQHAVRGHGLGHFFQRDFVDHALDALRGFAEKEWFSTKSSTGDRRAELFADVAFGATRITAASAVRGGCEVFSINWRPSMRACDSRRPAGPAIVYGFQQRGRRRRWRW